MLDRTPDPSIILRYPWREVLRELMRAPISNHDGQVYECKNAMGGPALPTLGCQAQRLAAGFQTTPRRRTSSAVYFVIEGQGSTTVDEHVISWSKNDAFVVPNWAPHHHINNSSDGQAVLFSVHDTPTLKALGLFREELL